MYSSVGRGSDEGQLNIREQKSGGGDERACVWWQWWWYRRGMLVTGSPAPGRKEVCGWQAGRQADKQTDSRAKGKGQQRCRSSTDCGVVVEEVAALLWDGANAVEWRRERQKRHFMQGPPLIWICRTNSLASLETASAPSTLRSTLRAHPGPRPSVRFFGASLPSESSGGALL